MCKKSMRKYHAIALLFHAFARLHIFSAKVYLFFCDPRVREFLVILCAKCARSIKYNDILSFFVCTFSCTFLAHSSKMCKPFCSGTVQFGQDTQAACPAHIARFGLCVACNSNRDGGACSRYDMLHDTAIRCVANQFVNGRTAPHWIHHPDPGRSAPRQPKCCGRTDHAQPTPI